MRNKLNKLYLYSGYLSAFFMVLIAMTIVAQILGRFVNITVDSTETAGFSLAALTFFGLSYTFHSGEHIRVTLFTRLLGKKIREMIPIKTIEELIAKHSNLEKELSSGELDKKSFAEK